MSLVRAIWHAFWERYFGAALEHMRIDHPDVPYVSLKYAQHRDQVNRFLREGR